LFPAPWPDFTEQTGFDDYVYLETKSAHT
jgi:hypothetical protein